ncbi:hypothetical protein [Methylocaldum sp.]|uniref:hypothetical protein n=1 Tax=Methylocaldum sp. TaxID=1969727 RepID=UPI002D2482A3|nr:hypothetical protein [Methylocaldum sp.]HYE36767.1 hypothetical protein [Methylocaldum sp.]
MKHWPLLLTLTLPFSLQAEELPVNYCKDPKITADWEKQLANTPEDPLVIKLYALRVGLCHMVDQGRVKLEEAIRIWDIEHARSVNERLLDEMKRGRKKTL